MESQVEDTDCIDNNVTAILGAADAPLSSLFHGRTGHQQIRQGMAPDVHPQLLPISESSMGNPMLRFVETPRAYSWSMRPMLPPAVRPPVLPRFPQDTLVGGSPTSATTPPGMPQAPSSISPTTAAILTPSLTNENPSVGGTTLTAQTQSLLRVNWHLQEVMVLLEAKKDLDVRKKREASTFGPAINGTQLQKLVSLVECIAPRPSARQSGSGFTPCSPGFVTTSAKYLLVATVTGKWM
ncbi:hypothetical protein L7F22_040242 [Adiantum nelumboides]|nr:hypothetical protein [Adiantum nelumboides]